MFHGVVMRPRLHVPAFGGSHHFAHFLPVAFELAQRGRVDVQIFVPMIADFFELRALAQGLGMPVPTTTVMEVPDIVSCMIPGRVDHIARMLIWTQRLRDCEAILCAERTSTIFKHIPGWCPKLIHIPHGAGDRAVGFEARFRLFDTVLVAGAKDRERLVAEHVVRPDACYVAGPVKIASTLSIQRHRSPLFANNRPVILYNPHFSRKLSSGTAFVRRLAEAIKADGRYNLIIAPHIRMAKHWTAEQRAEWEALAIKGQIVVDLGSPRLVDMTYTLGADLYIGDVSSQVYEFLIRPRPCLFINAHNAAWAGNADYAMWQLGDVVTPDCAILPAIERAFQHHSAYRPLQEARANAALDGLGWDAMGEPVFRAGCPIMRAADIVEREITKRLYGSTPDLSMPAMGQGGAC